LVLEVQRLWIFSTVVKIACEQGVESVSVAQIISRARVSRSRFYELFETREDCLLQTFEQAVALAAKRVIAAYEAELSWMSRVRAALLALLTFFDEEPELARVCVVHALQAGPQALARRGQVLEQLTKVLDEGGSRAARAGMQPQPLIAELVVGGVHAVIHARLLQARTRRLADLLNPLMFMIVLPYLGPAAARNELRRPAPQISRARAEPGGARDPLADLNTRLTYRTLQALAAIAAAPGISNREVADAAGVRDEGQISKLLARVQRVGLVRNTGPGHVKGGPNAWTLTSRGAAVEQAAKSANLRVGR
jgi:AcrR family transcriptional regulator